MGGVVKIIVFMVLVIMAGAGTAGTALSQQNDVVGTAGQTPGQMKIRNDPGRESDKDRQARLNEIYAQLPPEDQERLIEETIYVEQYCNNRTVFASLHDCQCVAVKFFDERILRPDPNLRVISIADDVADECPNVPGVAGYAFNECVGTYNTMPYGLTEYCECYAKTYAKLYEQRPVSSFPSMGKISSAALSYCNSTGIESPFTDYTKKDR